MVKKPFKIDFCDEFSTSEFGFDFTENVYEGKRKNLAAIKANA